MQAFAKLLGQSQSKEMAQGFAAAAASSSSPSPIPDTATARSIRGNGSNGKQGGNGSAIPLPDDSVSYNPALAAAGAGGGGGTTPQPRVEPIAHLPTILPSPPGGGSTSQNSSLTGSLLDVTPSYIVYSVKKGLVRVLDRDDGSKTLLRGHTVKCCDVTFFGDGSGAGGAGAGGAIGGAGADVLATVGGAGDKCCVLIWRLLKGGGSGGGSGGGGEQLGSEKLLEIRYRPAARLVLHPFDPNRFVLLHRDAIAAGTGGNGGNGNGNTSRIVATLVETTRLVTVPHADGGHAVCLCGGGGGGGNTAATPSDVTSASNDDGITGSDIEGAIKLIVPGNEADDIDVAANDLVFSPTSARHVLTAHEDGVVRLWDGGSRVYIDVTNGLVHTDGMSTDGGQLDVSAALLSSVHVVKEGGVVSCRFLPGYVDARPPSSAGTSTADDVSSYLTPPFLTGCEGNTKITLWSPFTTTGSPPVPVRTFKLDIDGDGDGDGSGGSGGRKLPMILSVGTTPAGETHAFLADSEAGRMFVLHLSSTFNVSGAKVATGFNYVAPFDTVHPIYSMKCTVASSSSGVDTDNDDAAGGLSLYCVQSKAIQVLTFTGKMLAGPSAGSSSAGVTALPEEDAVGPGAAKSAAVTDDEDAAAEALVAEFEDYSDEEEMGDDDEDLEGFEDYDEDEAGAPAASSLPPPGLQQDPAQPDPFANWLGALASGTTSGSPAPEAPVRSASSPLPPGLTPPPAMATTQSQGDFTSPPPPPGAVPPTPAPTPQVVPKPAPHPSLVQQALLSPIELLSSSSSLEKDSVAAGAPVSAPADKKANERKHHQQQDKQEKKAKSSTGTKHKKGKSGGGGSAPSADAPGKIAILKRDQTPLTSNAKQELAVAASATPITTHAALVEDVRVAVRTELLSAGLAGPSASKEEQPSSEALATAITKSVTKSLEKSLADPVKKSVEKLVAADKKRQDGSADAARAERMASAVADGVKGPVVEAFHGAMRDVMIPAYEAATRQMFAQVSSTIAQGMEQQARAQAEAQAQAQASSGPDEATLRVMQKMSSQMESMARTIEGLRGEVARLGAVTAQSRGGPGGMGPPGMTGPPGVMQQPPPPQLDPAVVLREEIIDLIRRRDYEAAFTKALSASDGAFAVFACKNSNLQDVIEGDGSPLLSQPILLCLMQQLGTQLAGSSGADLRTELTWIQDISVTLNPNDAAISQHVGGVLKQLMTNITDKMNEGDPNLQRPLRMLLQVIRGIGS